MSSADVERIRKHYPGLHDQRSHAGHRPGRIIDVKTDGYSGSARVRSRPKRDRSDWHSEELGYDVELPDGSRTWVPLSDVIGPSDDPSAKRDPSAAEIVRRELTEWWYGPYSNEAAQVNT